MTNISVIGLVLSKNVFHAVGLNQVNKIQMKKKLRRAKVIDWFRQQEFCTASMESCGTSHYWARELEKQGFEVKLIPPEHVKAFVRGNKNDFNDALAIAESTFRPDLHYVAIKTIEQQDIQAMHRLRTAIVKDRTALCNRVRGLLSEYGIAINQGVSSLRRYVQIEIDSHDNGLSDFFRELLQRIYACMMISDG